MIIDVSVEIAALCRSASIPYSYVRLPGNRNDKAHIDAFKGAVFLLAYFPSELESEETPSWVIKKTIYLGFLNSHKAIKSPRTVKKVKNILIISGKGGNACLEKELSEIAIRFKDCHIIAAGHFKEQPAGIKFIGFTSHLESYLEWCDLTISNCGLNTVATIAPYQKQNLLIPEDRPFKEQHYLFERLLQFSNFYSLTTIKKKPSLLYQENTQLRFNSNYSQQFFEYLNEETTTAILLEKLITLTTYEN